MATLQSSIKTVAKVFSGSIVFTTRQRCCGKAMFSLVSVCLFTEAHVTITHDALDINVEGPMALALPLPSGHQKWDLSHPPLPQACALLMKPDGQHWRPVQTCSLEGPLIWGHGAVRTGWYASYWNAFLLFISSSCYISLNTGFYLCFLLLTSCRKSLI